MAKKIPVVVYLKGPTKVLGLPKEIMAVSHRLARDHGGRRKWTFGFDNRIFITDLEPEAIEKLRGNSLVEKVVVEEKTDHVLSEPFPAYDPEGINTDWGTTRIKATIPWNKGFFGQGIKVGIVDSGINKMHESFWKDGICVVKGGYDFVNEDGDADDDHGHGTWVGGIVGMQHNDIVGSYRGIAPGVELYAVKVFDQEGFGTPSSMAAGIDWCRENGMHIINLSIKGAHTDLRQLACDSAYAAGCLLVAGAGNDGPSQNTVSYPAKYASVIAVGAVDRFEEVAGYSSRGPELELAAPGSWIVGPNDYAFPNYPVDGSDERYVINFGTSAACPMVSAAAALIKSMYPGLSNTRLRDILRTFVRDL